MAKLITVSGGIASGKTTFITNYAEYLRETYGVTVNTFLESVDDNELLALMYRDPSRWTYTSQVRFLADKINSMKRALECPGIVLVERDYREQKIFIDAQLAYGSVTKLEYDSYLELYEACASFIPNVTNYYINVPLDIQLYRMQERGRSCESLGSTAYYSILDMVYKEEYKDHPPEYTLSTIIDIDTYRKLDPHTFKGVYKGV